MTRIFRNARQEVGDIVGGIDALRKEREKWLDSPDLVMRAARHYEGALQALIRHAVMSVYEHIKLAPSALPPMNTWVTAECPARVDLQGGWTDTPPICYEMGGSVVNVAVLVDGKKPIGARARRVQDLHLKFTIGSDQYSPKFIIGEINDLLDYNQPKTHGALLKAAILCTQLVDVESNKSLSEQLCSLYGGGLELQTWSDLPQGTGLGTSSILAAAVIAILWTISGRTYHKKDLIHAVLYLEQLLTTGGGWQDQVGGVMGNINRGYSLASFPIQVFVEPLSPSSECLDLLNRHLVLLYTGRVRLAKNLLQNVIRNWYAGDEEVVCCFKELYQCSLQCVEAIKKGDLSKLGELIDCYWRQKKLLAPGCEPVAVQNLMTRLKPFVHGQVLMGAGGGGFMCILTKEPDSWEQLQTILRSTKGLEKVTLHRITIDTEGITVTVGTSRLSL
ncbi:L-fucose kinase-like isoform X2 [Tachypleus tridentatus]|uniref:L-fucose kinase-like isoform X2 n=1 Tax=Tachypleus tridentatus TaxID=6853 RepID=UPI003FD68494